LLRTCFAEYGGQEMGTEGDSFYVVFQSAGAAVSCCVAAQRALSAHAWPEDVAVRVRMGLHSGEPTRRLTSPEPAKRSGCWRACP
jgi:class 3 adenylate cyclase